MKKQAPTYLIPSSLNLQKATIKKAIKLFGTPLFLYDVENIKYNWKQLNEIIPDNTSIYYSVKANPNVSIIKVFKELGAFFEVASEGELNAVLKNNIKHERIIFVGPGKTDEELKLNSKAIFVVESKNEIDKLNNIAQSNIDILLRINPKQSYGVLSMGGNTQFGMSFKDICFVMENKSNWKNINIIGIHCYLGTGILNFGQIINNSKIIITMIKDLELKYNYIFKKIDIGGGFGIPYFKGDIIENMSIIKPQLQDLFNSLTDSKKRNFAIESGRFLIGRSGVFITKVLDVKKNDQTTFVIVDGGINNLNYNNNYGFRSPPFTVLTKNRHKAKYSICGNLCTPADRISHNTYAVIPFIGDYIVFYQAGAYGLTAATNMFLSHSIPPEVLYKNGELYLIRKKTNSTQIIEQQIIV